MKAQQQRIADIQAEAQQLQMRANNFIGNQQDINNIGRIGEEMYNQAMQA